MRNILYISTLLIVVLLIAPVQAFSSYNPAPERLVKAALQTKSPPPQTVQKRAWIVCQIFRGRHCRPALNVAWCESGIRPNATNGQYLGVWQFGAWARSRFGFHRNIWEQTRAARRYWLFSGWRPWQCRP